MADISFLPILHNEVWSIVTVIDCKSKYPNDNGIRLGRRRCLHVRIHLQWDKLRIEALVRLYFKGWSHLNWWHQSSSLGQLKCSQWKLHQQLFDNRWCARVRRLLVQIHLTREGLHIPQSDWHASWSDIQLRILSDVPQVGASSIRWYRRLPSSGVPLHLLLLCETNCLEKSSECQLAC
jgi:hypothetical protein